MESISLKGEVRKSLGKADAKAARRAGNVPCIIYGGEENVHFAADAREFKKLIYTPNVYIVQVEVDGKTYDTIMKDVQYHPITDNILHVDFQLLTGRPVTVNLPIRLNGTPIGVRNGGKLKTPLRSLKVKGNPTELADAMYIDVEKLRIGRSIKVADLTLEGGTIMNSPDNVVVAVKAKRGAVDEDIEEDEEGTEGGEAAEGGEQKEEAAAES
jgi:large subunit ribosomal protein L25